MRRIKDLLAETKREPEIAKNRMIKLEETLRRVRDQVFDERGVLVDKAELNRRKRAILKVHETNAIIWSQRMSEVLKIAEHFNCSNLNDMQRIHNLEAMAVVTSVIPEILRGIS